MVLRLTHFHLTLVRPLGIGGSGKTESRILWWKFGIDHRVFPQESAFCPQEMDCSDSTSWFSSTKGSSASSLLSSSPKNPRILSRSFSKDLELVTNFSSSKYSSGSSSVPLSPELSALGCARDLLVWALSFVDPDGYTASTILWAIILARLRINLAVHCSS